MRKLYQPFSVLNDVTFIRLKYDYNIKETHCHSFLEKRPYLVLYLGFRLAFTPRAKVNQAEFKHDETKVTINLVFRSVTIISLATLEFSENVQTGENSSVETTRLTRTETRHDFLAHGDLLRVSLYGRQGRDSVLVPKYFYSQSALTHNMLETKLKL